MNYKIDIKSNIPAYIQLYQYFRDDIVQGVYPYTFITRCKECGVNHELVMLWDGHKDDKEVKTSKVDRGYTDYSEEYVLSEAEKVNYEF